MKKKNQELEKFKFVLDYKIQELKKQIEPRENDIKAMKDQIQGVCAVYAVKVIFLSVSCDICMHCIVSKQPDVYHTVVF